MDTLYTVLVTLSRALAPMLPFSAEELYQNLVRRGDVSANVDMKPGDILIIPESWF